jgi:hypothetical protein
MGSAFDVKVDPLQFATADKSIHIRTQMISIEKQHFRWICSGLLLLFTLSGCRGNHAADTQPVQPITNAEKPYVPNSGSAGFDIMPVPGTQSASEWIATYQSQGKTAKFRIVFETGKSANDPDAQGLDIKFGPGWLAAERGSDAGVLLVDLKKALEAKVMPNRVKRVSSLPFTFASLGSRQSRFDDGGFGSKPPGNWTPTKVFLGEGAQECEVFLNLNPVLKKGEFSIKDADYGDAVLAELAKVL